MSKRITTGHGRVKSVTEVETDEINRKNKRQRTADNQHHLYTRRRLEDFKTARELEITVDELNQNRMIG